MCPCSPNDVSIPIPDAPSGPAIPGFGVPFALNIPNITTFPEGFPEDLLDVLSKLQLLLPPGVLKPNLSVNFSKDILDGLLNLLDQFMPFLMLYKFFLPALNLIICIIEIICSLLNPEKLINAIVKLFRTCIPEFLNLFPVFALITMIISLILMLIALIEYLVAQILKLVELILANIIALEQAFAYADATAIIAIANKIGATLCIFQNLFVIFEIFNLVFQAIKDIAAGLFSIPPCADTGPDSCCTTDVCPAIVKTEYTRTTGTFKYLNQISLLDVGLPPPLNELTIDYRNESWQLYDTQQQVDQAFSNIYNAYDVPVPPEKAVLAALGIPVKPIFFPTDVVYTAQTPPNQAAYTIDLRVYYNPNDWGRTGKSRFIRFKDCIVTALPNVNLKNYDNSTTTINNAVISLAGGIGYEDDGTTLLTGFDPDGITPNDLPATLNNFLHKQQITNLFPSPSPTDGYLFTDIEYTFKPNIAVLLGKNLITTGCVPEIALNKSFINTLVAGDAVFKLQLLRDILNGPNFPNLQATQECLTLAVTGLRNNLTRGGVANFQALATACLDKLKSDANQALSDLIGLGFDPCKSTFTATPVLQFTTKPIKISVDLKEKNGVSISTGIPADLAEDFANRLKAHVTFGEASKFTYDGYQFFNSDLTSKAPGKGSVMVSFDNNIFCTNNIPADVNIPPSRDLQEINYEFIFSSNINVGEGDSSDGKPRFDVSDLLGDRSKDNV